MRGIKNIIILFLIGAGLLYLIGGELGTKEAVTNLEQLIKPKETSIESKASPQEVNPITGIVGDVYGWMGKEAKELESQLGEPLRKDLSSYGYTWWVYTNQIDQYIQFGISDDKIVTIFATGDDLSTEPVQIGESYQDVNQKFNFTNEVSFSNYRFKLNENDMKVRPLSQIDEDTFIQFYFDSFTEQLSSIRILSTNILLMQRPYEIFYRGELVDSPLLTDQDWQEIEKGMEQQIFDITNVIRSRFDKGKLEWDESVAEVAFGHSKDMSDNNYFSHYTLNGDGLKERLSANNFLYLSAGENIAAQYTDGPAAVEGWLNSEGHREALLKAEYTHLGVGVYQYYYTQNFLQKIEGQ